MTTLRFDARQFAAHHDRLAKSLRPAIIRGVRSGILRALVLVQQKTRTAAPANPSGEGPVGAVDTAAFLRGWKAERHSKGGTLLNDATHAGVVEEGRRPGRKAPPQQVIYEWLKRRGGMGDAEARSAAFMVARAIGRRGLLGRHIVRDNMDEIVRLVMAEVEHEVHKELSRP